MFFMGWTDNIKTITDLLAEINKADSNDQQKKIATELRKIKKEMEKQRKNSRKDLIISIIITTIVAFAIGYYLKYNL